MDGEDRKGERGRGRGRGGHTWPAVSFWFFSRALSRWLPRAMVVGFGGGVSGKEGGGEGVWLVG